MKAELIEAMGSDLTVVNAARVSFDKESEWDFIEYPLLAEVHVSLKDKDKKLISYLAKHNHFTPFTHPQITIRETVPIFVARQRFKHVVGFTYNEVSRRYVDDDPEFYVPDVWRKRPDGSVKQGSGEEELKTFQMSLGWTKDCPQEQVQDCPINLHVRSGGEQEEGIKTAYKYAMVQCLHLYQDLIDSGVAPEQARMVLPQSMYTSYYVTGSLAAFARMCKQRLDPHAQQEIQELAKMVDEIIRPLYPESWKALMGE